MKNIKKVTITDKLGYTHDAIEFTLNNPVLKNYPITCICSKKIVLCENKELEKVVRNALEVNSKDIIKHECDYFEGVHDAEEKLLALLNLWIDVSMIEHDASLML